MAVTKQTYTAAAGWTSIQLADTYRSAFIDAGLMTDWFDSYESGSGSNRILRVDYDNTKTYGSTYYWFYFTTAISGISTSGGVYLSVATGWNTTTKVPTGVQYVDFLATTPSGSSHFPLFTAGWISNNNTFYLDRYTSSTSPSQSWFVARTSFTSFRSFTIEGSSVSPQPWVDLNKGFYSGFYHVTGNTSAGGSGTINFRRGPGLRREITAGCGLTGSTNASHYLTNFTNLDVLAYAGIGNTSNNTANYQSAIHLPVGFTSTNNAYTSNSNPVFYGVSYSPYSQIVPSSEFGVSFHYDTNSFLQGDRLVVQSGVEEWEILHYSSNSIAPAGASPLFLARVV